jgi:hypothetical protein
MFFPFPTIYFTKFLGTVMTFPVQLRAKSLRELNIQEPNNSVKAMYEYTNKLNKSLEI